MAVILSLGAISALFVIQTDCQWSKFSAWSECSVSCGSGFQERERKVLRDTQRGGRGCFGKFYEERVCHSNICPYAGRNYSFELSDITYSDHPPLTYPYEVNDSDDDYGSYGISEYYTGSYDTSEYDPSEDASDYDTSEYDTSEYVTSEYEYDKSEYDSY